MLAAVSRAPELATRTAGRFAGFGTADGLLIATVVLWGLHFPMVKYAITHGFAALVYATMRFGVGSAVFAGITTRREGDLRVRRRDLGLLVGLCGMAMYVNQIAFVSAVKLTNASCSELEHNGQYETVSFTFQKITWTWIPGGITAEDDWQTPVA